jgi:hypothetical protein
MANFRDDGRTSALKFSLDASSKAERLPCTLIAAFNYVPVYQIKHLKFYVFIIEFLSQEIT